MTKKRISPEINAISTLLFVTVLILLIVINLREASQEKAARKTPPLIFAAFSRENRKP